MGLDRGGLDRRERARLDPGPPFVEVLAPVDRPEIKNVTVELPDLVAPHIFVRVVLVQVDIERQGEHLLRLWNRQLGQLLAFPPDPVVVESALLPVGSRGFVPEECIVDAHVDSIAASDLASVRQERVGAIM